MSWVNRNVCVLTENLNEKSITKATAKQISEKILNGPMMSDENNETDHLRNDRVNFEMIFTFYTQPQSDTEIK